MSGGQALGGTPRPPRQQRAQSSLAPTPSTPTELEAPPGFETLFMNERGSISSPFEAFILPLHWSLIRGGLRLRPNVTNLTSNTIPSGELTELLPANWKSQITTKPEEGTNQPMSLVILRYWDPLNGGIHYEAKVLEVVKNQAIVVILFKAVNGYGLDGNVQPVNRINMNDDSPTRNAAGSNFMIWDYFQPQSFANSSVENKRWFEIYKNLQTFETLVWEQLMENVGLNVTGKPRKPGPYESKSRSTTQTQSQQPPQQTQSEPSPYQIPPQPLYPYATGPAGGIGGPLAVPPPIPAGGGGLGRSDLDPLGGFGGGMVADPRGFRQPPAMPFGGTGTGGLLPPPPGARFDPFGPPNPVPNPGRPMAGPNPGTNWGVPNPDAEQPPPGFDDMFM